jgi:hypothetical protein
MRRLLALSAAKRATVVIVALLGVLGIAAWFALAWRDRAHHRDDRFAHDPGRLQGRALDAQLPRERALLIRGLHSFRAMRLPALAAIVVMLGVAAGAWGYFTSTGTGTAGTSLPTLAAPTGGTASVSGTAVSVSWTGVTSPTSGALDGYYVQRFAGSAPSPACGSSASDPLPATSTSCTDTGNPSGSGVPAGTYTYEVTAVWRSWSAQSGASNSVIVQGPSVTSSSPSSRGQGSTSQSVTISGTNFVSGASASFSGAGITVNSTTFNSATSLTANITIASGATTGAGNVTVTNPDGDRATGTGVFTVNAGPTVTSSSPSSRGQGATSQSVTITGTGFVSGASASFSGTGITVNSTTFVSATSLTANITIASGATTGTRNVTVTNPDGGVGTGTNVFTVNAGPTVTSTSPSSGDRGATSFSVTITGTNFVSGTGLAASFSGTGITVSSTTFVSATQLTANIAIAAGATTGARNVTVTNPDGGVGTGTGVFTVNAAPTVTSTSPSSGDQGATSFNVTITGTNFVTGASASFSGTGITVNSTTFVSATSLTATIAIAAGTTTGTRNVTVTNGDHTTATGTNVFTVNGAPLITSPSTGSPVHTGQNVQFTLTVTGTNFANGLTVTIPVTDNSGNYAVNSFTWNGLTSISVTITGNAGNNTTSGLTVTNPDGSTVTSTDCLLNGT